MKTALEQAGFGLPEPIYRLRFDPRTIPLPFENIVESTPASRPSPPSSNVVSDAAHEDVRPDDEVKEMVEAERAAGTEGEADLLDQKRPVE